MEINKESTSLFTLRYVNAQITVHVNINRERQKYAANYKQTESERTEIFQLPREHNRALDCQAGKQIKNNR